MSDSRIPAPLTALVDRAGSAGIFCDFDGCLSPIVPDPDDARAVRGGPSVLARLARRFAVVGVVSGRSVADLARRMRAPGVRLIGLHGMEELRDGSVTVVPEAEAARSAIERAGDGLARSLRGVRGALLERKGLALAVHFRRAADPDEAERIATPLVIEVAEGAGLVVVPGRRILEVRPRDAGNKGVAVRKLIEEHRLTAGLTAGDDVGDLPAFAALDGLDVAVRVAVASPESPPELSERADVVIDSPQEFVRLLRRLNPR
ncbi:MAG: trehalose-phosphatase [Actinomycetota bacterium]